MADPTVNVSAYGIDVAMPGCDHRVHVTVPVTLVADPGDAMASIVCDELALRRALWAHVRTCELAQARLAEAAPE